MKKHLKNIIHSFLLLLVIGSYVLLPLQTHAATDTLGALEDELNALKKQKQENDAKQQQTEAEIEAKRKAIANAQSEMKKAEEEIQAAEIKIEESNQKIAEMKEKTEKLLVFLQQMKGKNAYIQYISGASSITDMIMRISAVEQITDSNQKIMEELEQLIEENKKLKEELIQKQKDLEVKIDNYKQSIATLNLNLSTYDQYEVGIVEKISQAQSSYNAAKQVCENNPNTRGLGRNARLDDCYNTAYNAGWLKPLNQGYITSTWGYRTSPITGQVYEFHNALDIGGNKEGTPVYAAAAGIVGGFISRYRCGGNMLYIKVNVGGKQYTTYYYHLLTVNVSVGQVVNQNTIIGTVGGYSTSTSHGGYDSCTTGAHLHFGVANGWYNSSIPKNQVITPPGFQNRQGYRFYSRTDYYG